MKVWMYVCIYEEFRSLQSPFAINLQRYMILSLIISPAPIGLHWLDLFLLHNNIPIVLWQRLLGKNIMKTTSFCIFLKMVLHLNSRFCNPNQNAFPLVCVFNCKLYGNKVRPNILQLCLICHVCAVCSKHGAVSDHMFGDTYSMGI